MPASPLITVMTGAARKAARAVSRDFGEVENLQVSQKGPADFVTRADRKAEKVLVDELKRARPKWGFVLEEGENIKGTDGQHDWVIDPIDGTTNFIHGIPHFAVSIGVTRNGEPVAGVVYNPISDELFVAERGGGAYLNDRRLRVSARRDIHDAVIACGVPHRGRGDHAEFRRELAHVQAKVAGIRRAGTASLDLAWVAAGRLDGYWERGLKPWDICAGIVLVREAGGFAADIDGGPDVMQTGDIMAGNEHMQKELKACIQAARAEGATG